MIYRTNISLMVIINGQQFRVKMVSRTQLVRYLNQHIGLVTSMSLQALGDSRLVHTIGATRTVGTWVTLRFRYTFLMNIF
jgi:hypothetical protein